MGARHSKKRKRAVESEGASGSVMAEQETSGQRVMSISPADIDPNAEPMTIDEDDILLTPRVLDQNAFNQLSETLRGLIEQANGAAQLLRDEFDQTSTARGDVSKASSGLHERLRVSARMLKAFQSQIDVVQERITDLTNAKKEAQVASDKLQGMTEKFESRVADAAALFEGQIDETLQSRLKLFDEQLTKREQAVADTSDRIAQTEARVIELVTQTEQRVESAVDGAEARVTELVTQTERRVESAVERAEQNLQPIITEAQQQAESLLAEVRGRIQTVAGNTKEAVSGLMKGVQGRIEALKADVQRHAKATVAQTQRCVDAIAEVVEGAEKNAADAALKSAQATAKIEKASTETSQIIAQVKHVRKLLGDDLLEATERIDELSSKSEKICRSVRSGQDELESAARRLAEAVASVHDADKKRQQLNQTCVTLVPLLEQLKPWESLFKSTAGEQSVGRHPIVRLLDEMRSGLGEDAARLSGTMRQMAARLDDVLRLNQGKAAVLIEPRDAKAQPPQITTAQKNLPRPAAKPSHAPTQTKGH